MVELEEVVEEPSVSATVDSREPVSHASAVDDSSSATEFRDVPNTLETESGSLEDSDPKADATASAITGFQEDSRSVEPHRPVITTPVPEEERFEDALSEEDQIKRALEEAESLKLRGNAAYIKGEYMEAISLYGDALAAAPAPEVEAAREARSVFHANRAMCHLQLREYEAAAQESSVAVELNPVYIKALMRRCQAQEQMDKLEEALADAKKVVEIDPSNKQAASIVQRLEPKVEERREKLKEEMFAKLKDLGNSILGNFGMSVDNFKAVKDPATGSYSLSYQS